MRRKEPQDDIVRNDDISGNVKPRLVDDQEKNLSAFWIDIVHELPQRNGNDCGVHCRQEQPETLPVCRMDEGVDVEPLVARVAWGNRARSSLCPLASHRWLQAQPGLIFEPGFDVLVRMENGENVDRRFQHFFSKRVAPPLLQFRCAGDGEPGA